VATMFMIYAGQIRIAHVLFGVSLLSLCFSLALSLREIQLSVIALTVDLAEIEAELEDEALKTKGNLKRERLKA